MFIKNRTTRAGVTRRPPAWRSHQAERVPPRAMGPADGKEAGAAVARMTGPDTILRDAGLRWLSRLAGRLAAAPPGTSAGYWIRPLLVSSCSWKVAMLSIVVFASWEPVIARLYCSCELTSIS